MSNIIKARFWVQSVKKTKVSGNDIMREVMLAPVVRPATVAGAEGNVQWSKYTPSGSIVLNITEAGAGQMYEDALGQDVKITMEIVDPRDPD